MQTLNLIHLFFVVIFSFSTIATILHKKEIDLPGRIYTECAYCNNKIKHYNVRTTTVSSEANTPIMINLILTVIMTAVNAVNILFVSSSTKGLSLQIINGTLTEENNKVVGNLVLFITFLIIDLIILKIYAYLKRTFGKKEVTSIIAICDNCGTVEEFTSTEETQQEEIINI